MVVVLRVGGLFFVCVAVPVVVAGRKNDGMVGWYVCIAGACYCCGCQCGFDCVYKLINWE